MVGPRSFKQLLAQPCDVSRLPHHDTVLLGRLVSHSALAFPGRRGVGRVCEPLVPPSAAAVAPPCIAPRRGLRSPAVLHALLLVLQLHLKLFLDLITGLEDLLVDET